MRIKEKNLPLKEEVFCNNASLQQKMSSSDDKWRAIACGIASPVFLAMAHRAGQSANCITKIDFGCAALGCLAATNALIATALAANAFLYLIEK